MAQLSAKHVQIDKANTVVVVVTSIAAFLLVFSLIATKTLASQAAYQNRVISAKKDTLQQLKANIENAKTLKSSYDAFNSTAQNVIAGNPTGSGSKDGDNAKIILDALPSSYDFPALATSLETLLNSKGVAISSIAGTDDEVNQSGNQSSTDPTPQEIPFQVAVTGSYPAIQGVITTLEKSIRPIDIQTLDVSGTSGNITLNITAKTYYQPAKSLNISTKVIK